jgi:DNA-directed RNA polymerase subunit beta
LTAIYSDSTLPGTDRVSFARISEPLEVPDLLGLQIDSFDWLIGSDAWQERAEIAAEEGRSDVPQKSGMEEVFEEIGSIEDSQGNMSLTFKDHHFEPPKASEDECKERDLTYAAPLFVTATFENRETDVSMSQTVFMGDYPLMTDKGTFIINGTERVVVCQLVRSPGVYFESSVDKTSDKDVYVSRVIPGRGAWLEFEIDKKDIVSVRLDRKRKQPVTTLLKARGWSSEQIAERFGKYPSMMLTLEKDTATTEDEALLEIYRKMRPGEPPTADAGRNLLDNYYFNDKRYDLAKVGRYKVNKKLGLELPPDQTVLTDEDIAATIEYIVALHAGDETLESPRGLIPVQPDDIDHFGNRRLRTVGELIQNQIRTGLTRMSRLVGEKMGTSDVEAITPQSLIKITPLAAAIKEFFGTSQLSQFMDQTNPLAGLTHKRRLSALGPGGLSRERAGFEVRDVHPSHYGRMCPIETPEGPNIGLIGSLATYGRVNPYGFVETPYRRVENGVVSDSVDYLSADEEDLHVIAQANSRLNPEGTFVDERVLVRRKGGEVDYVAGPDVDYIDVSPRQMVSVATAMIPFLEHDDANRALMGSNMQRQAVPLLQAEAPLVGTGMEFRAAFDTGDVVASDEAGMVIEVSADLISIQSDDGAIRDYGLQKFRRSNQGTSYNQKPLVEVGQQVAEGQVIADGPSTENGELSLGRNLLVAFMPWEGHNYEDAIILSERLVRDDVLSSIHIEEHEVDARDTKLGPEEITRDIPNLSDEALAELDERGIVRVGADVQAGDILVGKTTPKGETELTPEERLLRAIFGEKAKEVRDTSMRVPHGEKGKVIATRIFDRDEGDELPPGVNQMVRVHVAQKRKITEGDKLAGRHGNKGVISKILPVEDMPFMKDGTPVDIVLNPLGVPGRMNLGQVLETHLGWVAKAGWDVPETDERIQFLPEGTRSAPPDTKVATPVFDGVQEAGLAALMDHALPNEDGVKLVEGDGKAQLFDGRGGEPYPEPVGVGYLYILKLHHLVDDKIHARSTGPYSMITQQPLGGKAQFGGQRSGEMEVWALEAYGAAYALQEILTIKSDDTHGRVKVYEAIVKGENLPDPGIPESFKVLMKEMQSLCLNVEVLSSEGIAIDMKESDEDLFRTAEELGIDLSRREPSTAEEV